jgi:hypothetical protein
MSDVVAINPATSTCAPGPKKTPFGFTSHTCPFANSWPWMLLAPPPVTRLSAIDPDDGCTNCTLVPPAIEKLCQFKIAFAVLCVITVFVDDGAATRASPACTERPVTCASQPPAHIPDHAKTAVDANNASRHNF